VEVVVELRLVKADIVPIHPVIGIVDDRSWVGLFWNRRLGGGRSRVGGALLTVDRGCGPAALWLVVETASDADATECTETREQSAASRFD
jgi:hypothetical protein